MRQIHAVMCFIFHSLLTSLWLNSSNWRCTIVCMTVFKSELVNNRELCSSVWINHSGKKVIHLCHMPAIHNLYKTKKKMCFTLRKNDSLFHWESCDRANNVCYRHLEDEKKNQNTNSEIKRKTSIPQKYRIHKFGRNLGRQLFFPSFHEYIISFVAIQSIFGALIRWIRRNQFITRKHQRTHTHAYSTLWWINYSNLLKLNITSGLSSWIYFVICF